MLLYTLIASALAMPAFGADPPPDLTQAEAQQLAAKANKLGSDKSLRSSATTAMQALIQFGNADLKGAITNAYKAYGSFKTSENLDRARKQGLLAKAALGGPDNPNITEKEYAFLTSSTSFRRLEPGFLSSGEDAKVAEEFEKKTGIKRQDFLDMLAGVSENKLYVNDPNLAEKVDSQFEGFVAKIPNPEFKAKVNETFGFIPSLSRHKFVVTAVQNMVEVAQKFMGANGTAVTKAVLQPAINDAGARQPAEATVAAGPKPAEDAADAKPLAASAEELEAILHPASLTSDLMAKSNDDGSGSHRLDGVIKAAIHDDPESETIFEKISRRYRMLTSDLVPPKETKTTRD